ncbi:hypothetical protein [Actinoplanes sp. CA-252034]|uniref:hypothetical protein n=1 Tax=Actinoplanes sp. CA-252034 TaxID=3239906 RepID=UPI003D993226
MRLVPFAEPALALVLLAGCTSGEQSTPEPTPSASPSASAGRPADALPEAEAPGGNLASAGKDADWDTFVLPCEDKTQEAVVQQVVTGDVSGDGVADALVVRSCDNVGTVEVFDGSSPAQRPWRIDQPLLGGPPAELRRPWITGVEVTSGEIVIKANGHAIDSGSKTCPKDRLVFAFKLVGTDFTQLRLETDPAGSCLPAG